MVERMKAGNYDIEVPYGDTIKFNVEMPGLASGKLQATARAGARVYPFQVKQAGDFAELVLQTSQFSAAARPSWSAVFVQGSTVTTILQGKVVFTWAK